MQSLSALDSNESLARCLYQSNHFKGETHSVLPKAFEPPSSNLRLSVFRICGLDIYEVWTYLQTNAINKMPQRPTFYGIADITVSAVQTTGLVVDPDNIPFRHASIIGWPEGDTNKSKRKLLSQQLASKAKLVLRNHD